MRLVVPVNESGRTCEFAFNVPSRLSRAICDDVTGGVVSTTKPSDVASDDKPAYIRKGNCSFWQKMYVVISKRTSSTEVAHRVGLFKIFQNASPASRITYSVHLVGPYFI